MKKNAIAIAIYRSFPVASIPSDLFGELHRNDDFENDIAEQLLTRKWTDINEHHWRMTGLSVSTIMSYMTPSSYTYYLPSLLIAALKSNDLEEFGVDALIPPNQRHEPRGAWWRQFVRTLNIDQRGAIKRFLRYAVDVSMDDSSAKINAEKALGDGLYD